MLDRGYLNFILHLAWVLLEDPTELMQAAMRRSHIERVLLPKHYAGIIELEGIDGRAITVSGVDIELEAINIELISSIHADYWPVKMNLLAVAILV